MIDRHYDNVDKFLIDAQATGPTFTMLIAPDPDSKDHILFQVYPLLVPPTPPCPIAKLRKDMIQRIEILGQVSCIRTTSPPLPFGRAWKAGVTLIAAENSRDMEILSLVTAMTDLASSLQQGEQAGRVEPALDRCSG